MRQIVSLLSGALIVTALTATPAQATPASTPVPSTGGTSVSAPALSQGAVATVSVEKIETSAKSKKKAKKKRKPVWRRALNKARTRAGMAYRYGGSGPRSFDCSGLTSWAYKKAGKKIPRTSRAQASAAKRIKKPRLGDLVFFHNGGSVYHVGLYAGKGKVFHASRPGTPVGKAKIWTSSVFYGRA